MNTSRRIIGACLLSAICMAMGACDALHKPYPEKDLFAVRAGAAQPAQGEPINAVLRVHRLRIGAPYSARAFLYRTDDEKYSTDYYNGFIAAPDQILSGELLTWMMESGLFRSVINAGSIADQDFILEGNIAELYGDYRNAQSPQAVMRVAFFLMRDTGSQMTVVFEREYPATAELSDTSPAALARGFSEAYRSILLQLTNDIDALELHPAEEAD